MVRHVVDAVAGLDAGLIGDFLRQVDDHRPPISRQRALGRHKPRPLPAEETGGGQAGQPQRPDSGNLQESSSVHTHHTFSFGITWQSQQ